MATKDRLTKRVKIIEKWIAENEEMGGPKGYLDTMAGLYANARDNALSSQEAQRRFEQLRSYIFEFLKNEELAEEWDEFLKEKDENAVQEQQTEEVPVQEQAENSKEASEAPEEEKK